MKYIQFNQIPETPWKNGLGVTRQIYIYPESSNLTNFWFRISAATISEQGQFSEYPNINRSLAVLDGNGLTINIKQRPVNFIPKQTIIHFNGLDPVEVTACPNKVLDFGVMSQASLIEHTLKKLSVCSETLYTREAPYTLLFSLHNNPFYVTTTDECILLQQYDSIFLTPEDLESFQLQSTDNNPEVISLFIAEFTLSS